MPFRRLSCRAALVVIPLVFASGCATDPKAQLDAATNAAITTSVRSLPGVTGATTTETTSPTDTVSISLTTALDGSSAEDVTSATELVRDAARHGGRGRRQRLWGELGRGQRSAHIAPRATYFRERGVGPRNPLTEVLGDMQPAGRLELEPRPREYEHWIVSGLEALHSSPNSPARPWSFC
jgi:hypothetical protein